MIRIQNYLINEKEILYIEKYAISLIRIHFKNADTLSIDYYLEHERDQAFEDIDQYGRD